MGTAILSTAQAGPWPTPSFPFLEAMPILMTTSHGPSTVSEVQTNKDYLGFFVRHSKGGMHIGLVSRSIRGLDSVLLYVVKVTKS